MNVVAVLNLVVSCYPAVEKAPGKVWIARDTESPDSCAGHSGEESGVTESSCPCKGHFLPSPTLPAESVQVWAGGFLVLLPSGMWNAPSPWTCLLLPSQWLGAVHGQESSPYWEDTVCTAHAQGPSLHPRDAEPMLTIATVWVRAR